MMGRRGSLSLFKNNKKDEEWIAKHLAEIEKLPKEIQKTSSVMEIHPTEIKKEAADGDTSLTEKMAIPWI